jgi:hypothetical protein
MAGLIGRFNLITLWVGRDYRREGALMHRARRAKINRPESCDRFVNYTVKIVFLIASAIQHVTPPNSEQSSIYRSVYFPLSIKYELSGYGAKEWSVGRPVYLRVGGPPSKMTQSPRTIHI